MANSREEQATDVLLVRVGARLAAIPLRDVVEVLRPLPVERAEGAAPFLAGLSVVRGRPTPVVDLRVLLGAPADTTASRWVSARLQDRCVALCVDEVVGTRSLNPETLGRLPSLLDGASDAVASLGVVDHQLLVLLRAGRSLVEAMDAVSGPRPAQ